MAIHPDYPGLTAEVIVDGDPLTEYRCDDNDVEEQPNTYTQYVQVDSDVNFSVRYTIPQGLYGAYGVRSNIKIDGKSVSSHNHNYEQVARRDVTKWVNTVYGTDSGMNYTYKLRFSKLDIDEEGDDLEEEAMQQLERTGDVIVRFTAIDDIIERPVGRGRQQSRGDQGKKLPMLGRVTEKSLKGDARSHQASLDDPVLRGTYVPQQTERSYKMKEPFAIFRFKYRSAAALKMLHVLPRTPSPPPRPRQEYEVDVNMNEGIGHADQWKTEPISQAVEPEASASTMRAERPGLKREANTIDEESEVMFLSSKRVKVFPTQRDEVIVLD